MSKRCPECRRVNEDSRIFCTYCGATLDAELRLIQDLVGAVGVGAKRQAALRAQLQKALHMAVQVVQGGGAAPRRHRRSAGPGQPRPFRRTVPVLPGPGASSGKSSSPLSFRWDTSAMTPWRSSSGTTSLPKGDSPWSGLDSPGRFAGLYQYFLDRGLPPAVADGILWKNSLDFFRTEFRPMRQPRPTISLICSSVRLRLCPHTDRALEWLAAEGFLGLHRRNFQRQMDALSTQVLPCRSAEDVEEAWSQPFC